MKTCKRCERDLPITWFYATPKKEDGRADHCKECVVEIRAEKKRREAAYNDFMEWLDTIRPEPKPDNVCNRGHEKIPENQRAFKGWGGKTYYACIRCDEVVKRNRKAKRLGNKSGIAW